MLILRRKAGEAISIGDEIRVVIIEVKGSQVKIGVEAPLGISIYRDELLQKILAENQEAAQILPDALQTDLMRAMFKDVKKSNPGFFLRDKENEH
ncbi:MAG: carbon storage regulator CsrA [Nitrospirae bacterium]|nr:carbon storage regulator CsrA [Candidatus Manganitrophaceae bacterium]